MSPFLWVVGSEYGLWDLLCSPKLKLGMIRRSKPQRPHSEQPPAHEVWKRRHK